MLPEGMSQLPCTHERVCECGCDACFSWIVGQCFGQCDHLAMCEVKRGGTLGKVAQLPCSGLRNGAQREVGWRRPGVFRMGGSGGVRTSGDWVEAASIAARTAVAMANPVFCYRERGVGLAGKAIQAVVGGNGPRRCEGYAGPQLIYRYLASGGLGQQRCGDCWEWFARHSTGMHPLRDR